MGASRTGQKIGGGAGLKKCSNRTQLSLNSHACVPLLLRLVKLKDTSAARGRIYRSSRGGLLDYTAHRGGEEKGGGRTLRKLPNHPARLRFSYFPPQQLASL